MNIQKPFRISCITVASAIMLQWSTGVFAAAGGLAFPEQGGPISGTAQAGQAAVARDASTAWLNPAGLTRIDKTQLLVGAQIIDLSAEFNPDSRTTTTGSNGGNAGSTFPGGSFYLAVPVDQRLTAGFSFTAPYGLPLEYKSDWVGRSYATELDLLTINIEPSLGYKVNDWVSIGVGIDFQYVNFEQKMIVPAGPVDLNVSIDGDSWEIGASLGILFEPSATTRYGLIYRTEMGHDLEGDLKTIVNRQVSSSLTIPQSLTFSAYHELDQRWAILADVGWTDWSAFDRTVIDINGPAGIEVDLPRNWKDTWNFGLGAHYRYRKNWLLMSGVSYVSSAVSDADRTLDIPVDKQWRFSLGFENEESGKFRWGANYTYADLGDNEVDTSNFTGRVAGNFDSVIQMVGVYGSWTY